MQYFKLFIRGIPIAVEPILSITYQNNCIRKV